MAQAAANNPNIGLLAQNNGQAQVGLGVNANRANMVGNIPNQANWAARNRPTEWRRPGRLYRDVHGHWQKNLRTGRLGRVQ